MCIRVFSAVSGSGVGFCWSGEDLIGAKKCACQTSTSPVSQQQSQTSLSLLLYPYTPQHGVV